MKRGSNWHPPLIFPSHQKKLASKTPALLELETLEIASLIIKSRMCDVLRSTADKAV